MTGEGEMGVLRGGSGWGPADGVVLEGDCIEVMATLAPDSIDAIVTDPPYGLEFMGKAWDAFRLDDPGTMRHRGDRVGGQGSIKAAGNTSLAAAGRVEYGAGKRPTTSRCRTCGKRDQFRNEHACPDSGRNGSAWVSEPIDRFAAPPASLAYGEWCRTWALEAYRVAKPGAHLLAFGGTRTSHRLAAALEDAGWEIRDCLVWAYAQGFPKSHNVGKAIDKRGGTVADFVVFRDALREAMTRLGVSRAELGRRLGNDMAGHYLTAGSQPAVPTMRDYLILRDALELGDRFDPLFAEPAEREVVDSREVTEYAFAPGEAGELARVTLDETVPATPAADTWDGWGTALKPAWEPIIMARKPLVGSVAGNVLTHGTGALNIDGTRIPFASDADRETQAAIGGFLASVDQPGIIYGAGAGIPKNAEILERAQAGNDLGRWPANVILTDPIFDGEVPDVVGGGAQAGGGNPRLQTADASAGQYSRFFLIPKADRGDREPVLRGQLAERATEGGDLVATDLKAWPDGTLRPRVGDARPVRENVHPTVKPVELMRHLVRLVTPPGGTVLDPFLGSGTTAIAAELEGFGWLGIEREPDYVAIARARLNDTQRGLGLDVAAPVGPRSSSPSSWPVKRAAHKPDTGFGFLGMDDEP